MTRPLLALGALLIGAALAGCLQGGPSPSGRLYTVRASTYYDHNRTAEEDRGRAHDLGFEDGDPATRDDPLLLAEFGDGGSASDERGDAPRCLFPDEDGIVDPDRSPPRFCIDLNATGQARLRVRVDGPVVLRSIGVDRAAEVGDGCYYGVDPSGAWGVQPTETVDRDLTFDIPYGIRCGD